jgi:DNA-binding beta-propeller fold protein YncE
MSTMKSTGKAAVGAVAGLALTMMAQPVLAASTIAKQIVDLGSGRVAIAMADHNRVYERDSLGQTAVLAGNGRPGFGGDEGPAGEAMLNAPSAVAVDGEGNLYIADTGNHRIRRVDAATGVITTVVGNGRPGFSGDGGSATEARLRLPAGVAADGEGNLFIADTGNHRVRRVDALSGQIMTIAGNGRIGRAADGDLATASPLRGPTGIVYDAALGRLVVAETGNHRVVSLEADGTIRVVAGERRAAAFSVRRVRRPPGRGPRE